MNNAIAKLSSLVAATAALVLASVAGPAAAHPQTAPPGAQLATGYYVALGDSVAAGYQPGVGDDPTGGYVGPVLTALRASDPKSNLVNLACSGETSTSLVEGGHCSYPRGSQLAEALAFLHAHTWTTRLVTVTIGANDVTPCLKAGDGPAVTECAGKRIAGLAANLDQVLSQVRAAAPDAQIVVTNYYNPYLALWFTQRGLVPLTSLLQARLNGAIADAARANDATTADVAAAFHSSEDSAPDPAVPNGVTLVCAWTWMCTSLQDIHPNENGYAVIGQTVAEELDALSRFTPDAARRGNRL